MPDAEIFVGLATLGFTLTGFSGIVAIIGQRRPGQWSGAERFNLVQLLVVSLTVTFGSFVPIVAATFLPVEPALRVSNGVIGLLHISAMAHGVLATARNPQISRQFPPGFVVVMLVGGGILILASIACAFNILGAQSFVLILNLLYIFGVGVAHFVALLTKG